MSLYFLGMLSDDSDDEHQAKVQKKSVGMGLIAPASSGLGLAASEGFIKKTSDQQSSYSSAAQKMMVSPAQWQFLINP